MHFQAGTIKRIHVDKRIIMANLKHGRHDPPLTVQTSRGSYKAQDVHINGPSQMVWADEVTGRKPLGCGARVWIETRAEVLAHVTGEDST